MSNYWTTDCKKRAYSQCRLKNYAIMFVLQILLVTLVCILFVYCLYISIILLSISRRIIDRMAPCSKRRQIDLHETSKCNKNVWTFFISVTYCSKDNLLYKLSYIRLITEERFFDTRRPTTKWYNFINKQVFSYLEG